jgi:hypothetical protein
LSAEVDQFFSVDIRLTGSPLDEDLVIALPPNAVLVIPSAESRPSTITSASWIWCSTT